MISCALFRLVFDEGDIRKSWDWDVADSFLVLTACPVRPAWRSNKLRAQLVGLIIHGDCGPLSGCGCGHCASLELDTAVIPQ